MKQHPLPKPPDRIVEIRERITNRKLADYNITRRRFEFRRRGRRAHYVPAELPLAIDTETKIVYTQVDD